MAKLTKAQREWRPGMPKKRRSTKVIVPPVLIRTVSDTLPEPVALQAVGPVGGNVAVPEP